MSDSAATSGVAVGYDAIRVNIPSLPAGAQVYAGYSTGSGIIPWTEAEFAAHATALGSCLRYDQDPSASDPTADILDVERGAATTADCPGWVNRALADFKAGKRPGQRSPAIYMSAGSVTSVVNALIAGGVKSGVGLVVANWSITETTAIADVVNAAGPFPIVGVQFADPGPYDVSVFSRSWLLNQAGGAPPPPPAPAPAPQAATVPVSVSLPVLTPGTSDANLSAWYVRRAQSVLNDVYGASPKLAVDGVYGPASQAAVKSLIQKRYGLTQDGIVGAQTWAKLLGG